MIDRVFKAALAPFVFALFFPLTATAQERYWIQLEAHATTRTAEQFAERHEQAFGNVSGFRLAGGWYGLATGPFETEQEANAVLGELLARRLIRPDAYVTDGAIYGERFWPEGETAPAGVVPPVAVETEEEPAPEAPGAVAEVEEAVEPEVIAELEEAPEPEIAAEVEETPEPEVVAEAEEAPEPAVAPEPEIEEVPEETLAEARRSEAQLTRDERADLQRALAFFGHYAMAIDAAFGPGTRRAMTSWQEEQGLEPTGVLTTRQREALLQAQADELARFGFAEVNDDQAGIAITLPMNMVSFERYESPFAHFAETNGSGMRVLLISQEGTQSTLFGLYEIMQTLEVIPLEGRRERRGNSFLLTGQSDTARAHAVAQYRGGEIKGWVLLWEPRADDDAETVLEAMDDSFRPIPGALPDNLGAAASAVSRRDLLAGLEVRRPVRSRSGFFVDARGTVVTTAEAVAGCERVTIDEAYNAEIRLVDDEAGIAVLSPEGSLVPLAFAQFAANDPRVATDVRVSGFSYEDTLSRPIISFGELADLQGLNGEPALRRLSVDVQPGDSGGPVFDANGAVMGMLLPRMEIEGRMLPDDVNFALSAEAIMEALERAQRRGAFSREDAAMPAEILTRVSADLTVLVSCWN
ncbi:MAG: trypsin-like peptidase domain-containing protein [Pararhodobacter sp.]|nr:trypsin-like peptidase domain-containing protein [Pararhodobacter sp.]